ncbi:MAG: phosphoenolpyruvate--protein phosphotransferase [Candidatus Omnitrophota bacterium]|nr:MAG: phosphoenolpyruvate--protein phosphotransferase [Candidatus Omnitrophota bacterium]RKY46210.1 MAG: phosphoenolpyruvate--protein phosphotransferase [Candidatus Omnitrophota bacterium]HDN86343.1 phosphoenolpyruvate--protein phosphotransferase [Candidatus Omnitrophota bacterium]
MFKVRGIAASRGIAIGKAFYIGKEELTIPKRKIRHEDISREIYRLEEALIDTRKEISTLQKKISDEMGYNHARIFEAHMLVLEDRMLIEDVITQIKNKKVNVEYAFSQSVKKYIDTLRKLDDEYLKERALDIEDVSKRVLRKLLKKEVPSLERLKEKVIIVAHDLSPTDTASLPKGKILGFVTDIGGRTSHTAIIGRSLGIPAVVGAEIASSHIQGGEILIVDGFEGLVYIKPTEKIIKDYQKKMEKIERFSRVSYFPKLAKAETKDGRRIIISANVELPEELPLVETYGAEGIGLYRTEYIFLGRTQLPSEEEQYRAYFNVARKIKPHSVIIRTIDIGGDKFLSKPTVPREMTPFLGWRAIRFCLANPGIFKVQLRAILRSSCEGNVKIMFPMISGIEELREAKKILEECKKELKRENKKFDENISVGAMIEVPSAALVADILAKECDFFSIGTNDLIQYSLAVDRADEKVAYLYEPSHPAVLKLIKIVVEAAHKNKIWVGMCGEMAGEFLFAVLLVGFGLDELSMPPPRIPQVKEIIRSFSFQEAKKIADDVLNFSTSRDVEKFLQERVKSVLKENYYKFLK